MVVKAEPEVLSHSGRFSVFPLFLDEVLGRVRLEGEAGGVCRRWSNLEIGALRCLTD